MNGTEWVAPGKGSTLGALRQAVGETTIPSDFRIRTSLLLTGGLLDRTDWARVREVCARPELHQQQEQVA